MRYFANPSTPGIREAMALAGDLGFIDTPAQGSASQRLPGVAWCADNGCYSAGYPGDEAWLRWLSGHAGEAAACAFAVAPDVVGDAEATLARSAPWLPVIRDLGYPAALAAQDGLEALDVPWEDFDVLFIGGTTAWKLGPHARALIAEAKARGRVVHMGRVNSAKRMRYAQAVGCGSADGTYLAFGPDVNLPKLLSWLRAAEWPTLFGGAA